MIEMDRSQAFEMLRSGDMHERLRASRFFSKYAAPEDEDHLQDALRDEDVSWIRARLQAALARARGQEIPGPPRAVMIDVEEEGAVSDIYAAAVEDTTKRLLHEIGPIAGAVRFYAKREIPNFSTSTTKDHLDRLADLLEALRKLSEAASTPVMKPFDLSQEVENAGNIAVPDGEGQVRISFQGPKPLLVTGDRELVELVLVNGIRNAVEATASQVDDQPGRVVISWDQTPDGPWVAILDSGPGPPPSADKAFEVGTSNKEGHLGMGLAVAQQAVASMGGKISLGPSGEGGARFFFSWPTTSAENGGEYRGG